MSLIETLTNTETHEDTINKDLDRSVLKWHVTKWVPQFRVEEGDIKLDLKIFYIFIFSLILVFLFILRTILFTSLCYNQVGIIIRSVTRRTDM